MTPGPESPNPAPGGLPPLRGAVFALGPNHVVLDRELMDRMARVYYLYEAGIIGYRQGQGDPGEGTPYDMEQGVEDVSLSVRFVEDEKESPQ